jgi:rRNA maturation endonuclease Nob1
MTRAGVDGAREIYVVDTSSIIQVRQDMAQEPRTKVTSVYLKLIQAARAELLVFPKAVIAEIQVGPTKADKGPDPASDWATACNALAVANDELFVEVREVLAQVPDLLDVAKTSLTDEADPYVVGLALKLQREGNHVIVITEETKDSPVKTSMRSACGVMGVPTISMRVFLARQGMWRAP